MYGLVPGIYKNGKGKPVLKLIDTSNQFSPADNTAACLSGDFLFKRKCPGLRTACIFTTYSYSKKWSSDLIDSLIPYYY